MKILYKMLLSLIVVNHYCCTTHVEVIESEHSTSMKFNEDTLWTFHHDPAKGKPYLHPLCSTDGTVFTDLPKTDHPWHRGLWFSWKNINGVNYWEEKGYTGIPIEGYTRLLSNDRKVSRDHSVKFSQQIEYAPSINAEAVLKETRIVSFFEPAKDGSYLIDWSAEFTSVGWDITLDRTPRIGQPGGKPFGGYAGLSIRMNKEMLRGTFLNSEGEELMNFDVDNPGYQNSLHGQSASWMMFQMPENGSLLFMDSPANFNYPTKWYVDAGMPYFSPAVIFDGPKDLKVGSPMKLNYRILVSPQNLDTDLADKAWGRWMSRQR